jgi:hypothetical protein
VLGPDYTSQTPAREASGRRCVRLSATGDFLEFTARADATGMVVRYSLPWGTENATLSLYINGKLSAKLSMTSKFCYLYGKYPFNNQPASGSPRRFWDELRLMPGDIHLGDTIRLQKDNDDLASQYLIDLVDLEAVPPPLPRPLNSVSVTQFGVTPNSGVDARQAFISAIFAAKSKHEVVWIPPGQYFIKGQIKVSNVTILGAGMWYSTLRGVDDYTPENRVAILGNGSNVILSDFAIDGNLTYRNDSEANDGVGGSFGENSFIQNIWIQHTKTGMWLVNSDGLQIQNCRFRDTIADGINLCLGMRNTTVYNCTARGTGDDCFAMWPATYDPAKYSAGQNRFVNCTAQLPYFAQAFSVYGGDANSVEDCAAIDIPYGAGLLASTMFPTVSGFHGITNFSNVQITRAGDRDGAIAVMTNLRSLSGLRFQDIDVIDTPTNGIKFTCVKGQPVGDTTFDRIRIVNPGLAGEGYGILADPDAVGSATMIDVSIINPRTLNIRNNATAFNLVGAAGAAAANRLGNEEVSTTP